MLSNILDRISFWSLFLVIVLLPVFILPFTNIPIEIGKGLLLVVGLTISIIFWTMARFFDGKIVLPKSYFLLSGLVVVLAFFLSALFSPTPQMSFFGIMFDVGSFWFVFTAFLLMLYSSVIVLKNPENARIIFLGAVISSSIVLFFQSFHLFMPKILSLGILEGKTDNLLGSWNAFGILAGFSSLILLFLIEFFSKNMSRAVKWVLAVLLVFSTVLVATVNFPFIWVLLGVSSLIIFVYRISFFSGKKEEGSKANFPVFSFIMVMVSLLFFMLGHIIGGYIPNRLGLSNIEIRPSFKATSMVTKSVLAKDPIFGMGPNKFADAWAMYKPVSINATSFWNTSFNSGSGLLPTLAGTTGYVGIFSLLLFLSLFIITGVKSFFSSLKNGINQEITAFFVASLYLFISSFFYGTGSVIFLLAFAFAGIFIGLLHSSRKNAEVSISFLNDPRKSFFSILFLVFIMIASAALSFKYIERFASVSHFRKVFSAQNIPDAEAHISKAISLHSNDLYFRTYAQVYLIKLNSLLDKGATLSEEENVDLKASFDKAISGAVMATTYNKENYLNFEILGYVYEAVAPLGVEGAYDGAFEAYQTASILNPANPGLKLALSRVSFSNKKVQDAKDYANQALSLKEDYAPALFMLSQIALSENNKTDALLYGQRALSLAPSDEGLIQYVNSLKEDTNSSIPQENIEESQ